MTDPLTNPKKPPVIDVDRHNDRIFVRVDGELVAVREEATGSIVWYDLGGRFTESDKNVIRKEVWAKMPWRAPHAPAQPANRRENNRRVNRAQRRKLSHVKKARG